MDRSDVITLIAKAYTQDAVGQFIPVETSRSVFCNLRSVTRAEWAAAGQNGLKAELVATMFAPDYHGEEIAEITQTSFEAGAVPEVVRYGIYRTYLDQNEQIELYLERKAGVTGDE